MVYDGIFLQKTGTFDAVDAKTAANGIYGFFKFLFLFGRFIFKQAHLFKGIFLDLCSAQTW